MIEESYVSFDTARMLKEVEFDIPVYKHYTKTGAIWTSAMPKEYNEKMDYMCFPCPTQALAARWLREVHHIDVVVDVVNEKEYCCDIYQNKQRKSIAESVNPSFEEILENGLKYGLELVKK